MTSPQCCTCDPEKGPIYSPGADGRLTCSRCGLPDRAPTPAPRCTSEDGHPATLDEHVDEVCGEGFYHLELLDDDTAYLQLGSRVFTIVGGGLFVVYREDRA